MNPPNLLALSYVYILQSQRDGNLYVGCTTDLKKRVREHNAQKVHSTAHRTPFILVYYEAFTSKEDAFSREKWLKSGWGRNHLKKMLSKTLESLGGSPAKLSEDAGAKESLGG